MNKLLRGALVFGGVLGATALLTRYWYAHADVFPAPLRALGNWLIDALPIEGAERAAEAELFYVLAVSFVLVSGAVSCVVFAVHRFRASRRAEQR